MCHHYSLFIYAILLPSVWSLSSSGNGMLFSGVRFWPPVSSALKELQIQTPTPIQSAAIAPLTAGVSCILHAETGSGKTLCYLLPLLKRLSSQEGTMDTTPIQAMIIVPTKELAVQVAADLNSLTAEFQRHEEQSLIHLCISTSNRKLDSIKSPILVGTPFKLLDLIKEASYGDRRSLQALRYIVVDEVDRLLLVPGRYASNDVLKSAKNEPTPTSQLLELLITSRGGLERANIQFVAASATVGRPLRRALGKLLYAEKTYTDVPVIRPEENNESVVDSVEGGVSRARSVGIPTTIKHMVMMHDGESDQLSSKLAAAKQVWMKVNVNRGIVFVPSSDDVKQAIGVLQFWGVKEAHNLQKTLGINSEKPLRGEGRAVPSASSSDLISRAVNSGVGASASLQIAKGREKELFVIPVSGSRGLHIQKVEYVIILRPPTTMDEYLHMAGRTGRTGSSGTVVTIANLEELKRMTSWQTALGIEFDVKYNAFT